MHTVFCCEEMENHLKEKEVAIRYDKVERFYGIKILDGGSSIQQIKFCPWCGTSLPSDLTDALYDIVWDELNLDGLDDPNLPEEFKSDEWWRKRNL